MTAGIVAGVFSLILAFGSPTAATSAGTPNQDLIQTVKVYTIQKNDTLRSIALREYGSEDYWTTIWDDNDWIESPDIIDGGKTLKLRLKTPSGPDKLADKLQQKYDYGRLLATNYAFPSEPAPINTSIQISNVNGPLTSDQINFLGNCESGMTANRNSGNGFYGAFQFTPGTWNSIGTGYKRADQAPLDVQVDAVQRLVRRSSIYGQFPACSQMMRAKGIL